jgi:hypothetical protein
MLPRVDLPELILEIAARTRFTDAFTHISERTARATDQFIRTERHHRAWHATRQPEPSGRSARAANRPPANAEHD